MHLPALPSVAASEPHPDFLQLLQSLAEVETHFHLTVPSVPISYIRRRNWLVRPEQVWRAIPRSLIYRHTDPSLKFVNLAKLTTGWIRGQTESLTSAACMIQVRPHWRTTGLVRSYYDSPNSSVKVTINSADGRRRMGREIKGRQLAQQIGEVTTPTVYACHDTEGYLAMHEQWLHVRPFRRHRDNRTLLEVLLPQLERHYRQFGVQEFTPEQAIPSAFADRVEAAANAFHWPSTWIAKRKFLKTIRDLEAAQLTLAASFCHGDLAVEHVLFAEDGSPMLVDWDGSRETAIASDLTDLARTVRPFRHDLVSACLQLLERFRSPTTHLPQAQILIMSLQLASKCEWFQAMYAKQGRPEAVPPLMASVFDFAQWFLTNYPCSPASSLHLRSQPVAQRPETRVAI